MSDRERFSDRHGFTASREDPEITVRNDAPQHLREAVLMIAYDCELSPSPVRDIICRVLRARPDRGNWSEYPNIAGEVEYLIDDCEWFEVYDIIEEIYRFISRREESPASFSKEINKYFLKNGIGWQLVGGELQIRGSEAFEKTVHAAQEVLEDTGRTTASGEIHQALADLSRRPDPDITGAVQHGMAALECVARDVFDDPRATLGELIKKHSDVFTPPLDQCLEKAWGFASERGRHIREGRDPAFEDAELVVGLASVVATYLVKKADAIAQPGRRRVAKSRLIDVFAKEKRRIFWPNIVGVNTWFIALVRLSSIPRRVGL